ncbi:uncharacterized protein LOC144672605 [Cetorhinus maximus]
MEPPPPPPPALAPPACPAVAPPVTAPPEACALPNLNVVQNDSDEACAALALQTPMDRRKVIKQHRSACLRRNASTHAPAQQRPRKVRRALNFDTPCNAPVTDRDPDNPPVERAAAERRGDVQAVALRDHGTDFNRR